MVIITHSHTYTHSAWSAQMKCKRQRGEREEFREKLKRKWGVVKKKEVKYSKLEKKREKVRGKKSGGYVNVESESSGGESEYNVLSWPGGRGAECPGAGGGRWPDLCGYHYVEGDLFSILPSILPPLLSQTPFLSQGKGELGWGAEEGEG